MQTVTLPYMAKKELLRVLRYYVPIDFGKFTGEVDNAEEFYEQVISERRKGKIPSSVNISYPITACLIPLIAPSGSPPPKTAEPATNMSAPASIIDNALS